MLEEHLNSSPPENWPREFLCYHLIALMCDNIEATVAELQTKQAQFRRPIDESEYGRPVMAALGGRRNLRTLKLG